MHRFVLALAVVPLAFASSAYAQTAPDDAAKTLWCGEASKDCTLSATIWVSMASVQA